MANSTGHMTEGFPATGLDISGNLTLFESISQFPAVIWQHRDLALLEFRIVGTSLACIYLASHAALRRPPSASPPKKNKSGGKAGDKKPEDDDQYVQGLLPSDAIMFPILAGTVLVGLYYLIKWLEDPAILNKILGVYFSVMSLASMGKLFADCLHFLTGLVFPDVWSVSGGTLYHFDTANKLQYHISGSGARVYDDTMTSPLPGSRWSKLVLPERTRRALWEIRHIFQEQWTIRFTIHGIVNERFHIKLNDLCGVVLAVVVNLINYATNSVFLSNIMGCAFSYTGIVMMSPTTFTTGSAVLFGLFFYDIYMVFYTPYMVTVATKLDIPIKLVFQGPTRSSMLGLGDIVVPGMFIGLCLRFDHFMYYYRQRKLIPVQLKTDEKSSSGIVTKTDTQRMVVKPKYVNPQGQWGNHFWTSRFGKLLSPDATPALKASAFPKPYFMASMIGYLLAMMATLAMLLIFNHAQPALLYLVPGVVSAVWLTGTVRGELHEMWIYTEDGSLDNEDVIVTVDANGDVVEKIEDKKKEEEKVGKKGQKGKEEIEVSADVGSDENQPPLDIEKKDSPRVVFAFTIEAPASLVVG